VVRVIRDAEIRPGADLANLVTRIESGYWADGRGDVVPFPRSRIDARGTTLAWLGAALPGSSLLGFRAYLYRQDGFDRGDQVVAVYDHASMELRALFLGRLVGNLRTGASIAAALHLIDPSLDSVGMLGTGYQARNALTCIAAVFPSPHCVAWSPTPERRLAFQEWAEATLGLPVDVPSTPHEVVQQCSTIVLVTASNSPVIRPEMLREPRLLVSISAYRRPEIDLRIIDRVPYVWTDSVAQATGPGTLLEHEDRRSKLRPLAHGLESGALQKTQSTRIVINTGAAWEEVITAQSLYELAVAKGLGTELALPDSREEAAVF
jgi:alanine dehydrogenase